MEPLVQIAADIYQVHLPLPFALNRVNVYLLRGTNGWTVLDSGLNTPSARAAWEGAFDALGIRFTDVEQVVLTHTHPDHYGMAGWFETLSGGAPVKMSPREAELARLVWGQQGRMGREFDRYLLACGMPDDMAQTTAEGVTSTGAMTLPHPTQVETIMAGDELRVGARRWRLIHARGHSDGQLLLYDADDRLLLCGDHVLMKITPNIGLWPDTEPDPLGGFLDSLDSLSALDVRLALPGHKSLITDWPGRLAELRQHHAERLTHTRAAVQGGATVYEAALKVFNSAVFSPHEWRFAMAETLAHLEYLRLRGSVRQDEGAVWRFRAV